MAGFITLDMKSPDKTWASANWVFGGFLDHVVTMVATDSDIIHELTLCKHHQNVDLESIREDNPETYKRIIAAFSLTCDRIAESDLRVSVNGRELDSESQSQYRQAVSELSQLLDREIGEIGT